MCDRSSPRRPEFGIGLSGVFVVLWAKSGRFLRTLLGSAALTREKIAVNILFMIGKPARNVAVVALNSAMDLCG